jgi:cytoplasmic FMR1 interacting protein
MVQHVLTDTVLREDKKERVKPMIQAVQDLVGDWHAKEPPIDEPIFTSKSGQIWQNEERGARKIPERIVAPTRTQLVLVRCLVSAIRETDDGKWVSREANKQLESFMHSSFFYGYLLNIGTLADSTADMGDLWYREHFLEISKQMSANKDIVQFPIKMSFPWILIEHIVNFPNPSRMENVLYALDIYNDAAMRALDSLGKRYAFDEVQAELNLCFDQVVYLIGERIYIYYKQQAAGILMDKKHRTSQLAQNLREDRDRDRPRGAHHIPTCASSVAKLLSVRNLSLVGRTIDLNRLLTLHTKKHLAKNVDAVIKRYESGTVSGIKELELQLNALSLTHELLAEHLELDSFEGMLKEANDDRSAVSFHGRIVMHTLEQVFTDFFPHWVYTSGTRRFLRGESCAAHEVPPAPRPQKMDAIDQIGGSAGTGTRGLQPSAVSKYMMRAMSLYSGYFGVEHVEAMIRCKILPPNFVVVRSVGRMSAHMNLRELFRVLCDSVLGPNNMPLIIYQLMKNLDMKITNVLGPYVKALADGFPERTSEYATSYRQPQLPATDRTPGP